MSSTLSPTRYASPYQNKSHSRSFSHISDSTHNYGNNAMMMHGRSLKPDHQGCPPRLDGPRPAALDIYNRSLPVIVTQRVPFPASTESFVSFDSCSSEEGDDGHQRSSPYTLHSMDSSSTSLSSTRSMPSQGPKRSALGLYLHHNIKPRVLEKRRKLDDEAVQTNSGDFGGTTVGRANSISSSLREFRRRRKHVATNSETPLIPRRPNSPVTPFSPSPPMSPMSPMTPAFEFSEAERRLRQLQKASRTLGENIPQELIFGGPETESPSFKPKEKTKRSLRRRASLSLSSLAHFVIASPAPPSPPAMNIPARPVPSLQLNSSPIPIPPSPSRPDSMMLSPISFAVPLPQTPPPLRLDLDVPEDVSEFSPTSIDSSPIRSISPFRAATPSADEVEPQIHEVEEDLDRNIHRFVSLSRPDTPFNDFGAPLFFEETSAVVRKERRQGWSGEWNQPELSVVIKKLRSLK
ncbi:hypothetical protein C8J56DRAFT_353055 [Mycena floridula]|nr:hypothetical protein C8J56DRAFT_353055 [Mycena floridula]